MPTLKSSEHETALDLLNKRAEVIDLTQAVWQKSTYSSSGGSNCVEVASNLPGLIAVRDSKDRHGPVLKFSAAAWTTLLHDISTVPDLTMKRVENMDLTRADWRKSTYSGANGGNCVEVATNLPGVIAVRDSKDPHGPALTFTPPAWAALLRGIRANDLDPA